MLQNTPILFLAFDVGLKRTGLATGNQLTQTTTPLGTLHSQNKKERLAKALDTIHQWQPHALVVGVPYHPDGAPHEMTRMAKNFAKDLRQASLLPVFEVDERYSSVEAMAQGAKAHELDAQSACIILAQFLNQVP
jgi:putative Holliday junction resolvase